MQKVETTPDAVYISAAREGDSEAFARLWERHNHAALRFASRLVRPTEVEDLTSEAFANIFQAFRNGAGPDEFFRPYLYVTLRNLAGRWAQREMSIASDIDLDLLVDPTTVDDASIAALERTHAAQAFRALPTRWQEVLWYTEVEGLKPHEVAPVLGISANSVAALSYRARAGFRRSWADLDLQDESLAPECRSAVRQIERQRAGRPMSTKLSQHVQTCAHCQAARRDLDHTQGTLRAVLLPLFLGASGAAALREVLATGTPAVAAALTTGAAAATAPVAHGALAGVLTLAAASALVIGVVVSSPGNDPAPDAGSNSAPLVEPPGRSDAAPDPDPVIVGPTTPPTSTPNSPAPPRSTPPAAQPPSAGAPTPAPTPGDTTAPGRPTLASSIDPYSKGAPPLAGTGEPGATVAIADAGEPLATTTVDDAGNWSVPPVVGLRPYTDGFTITQSDAAGNTSEPLTVEPGFRPQMTLTSGSFPYPDAPSLQAEGWPGALFRAYLDGVPVTFSTGPDGVVAPNGTVFSFSWAFMGPGTYDVAVGYVDPSTSEIGTLEHFQVTVTP